VDLVWSPPGGQLDHLTVTGYKIIWFQPEFRTRVSNVTVVRHLFMSTLLIGAFTQDSSSAVLLVMVLAEGLKLQPFSSF